MGKRLQSKIATIERNIQIRYRSKQLKDAGILTPERLEILSNEFFLSEPAIIGILYSKKIKEAERGVLNGV